MNDIPKIIHYCWFGGNELPDEARKCIDSWKKYMPDYEIKEWNESNFDINSCDYSREAAEQKKWAFVSDYARFAILYKYGGVYFDTDVEVVKPLDDIIESGPYMGLESGSLEHMDESFGVASGLGLAAKPGMTIYKNIIEHYKNRHFATKDGKIDTTTVVQLVTAILKKEGINVKNGIGECCGIKIYPKDYFCPQDYMTGEVAFTNNTRTIHHYSSTWMTPTQRRIHSIKISCIRKFGEKRGLQVGKILSLPWRIINKIYKLIKHKK